MFTHMDKHMIMTLLSSLMFSKDSSIINIFIMLLLNALIYNYKSISRFIQTNFKFYNNKTEFKLKAKITYRNNMMHDTYFSESFLAICRKLRQKLEYTELEDIQVMEYQQLEKTEDVLFFSIRKPLCMEKDISICTRIIQERGESKYDMLNEYINLEIIITTGLKKYGVIRNYIDQAVSEYKKERMETMKKPHLFMYNSYDAENKTLNYLEYPFKTTKTINNMFFDEKAKMLSRIDNFLTNQEEYIRLGIPYTLGILLHGLSGVGKTSIIKMIAQYTNRHIVIIPLNKIKCIDTLRLIMLSSEINHMSLPTEKRLYVFEDADCSTWKDILMRRELQPKYTKPDVLTEVLHKLSEEKKPNDKKDNMKMKITLGDILELLDGLIEMDGRMIIMTTNHVNTLDTALIRPGRFDLNMELKHLSTENIKDMYNLWFPEKEMSKDLIDDINNHQYTQAEIGNLFASYKSIKDF